MTARTQAAVLAARLALRASRRLGRGGTAFPGLVAARLDADVVTHLARRLEAAVLVTGTNGKTTTARLLAAIAAAGGRRVVHNRAGSNLMRGIASALIEAADPLGRLPGGRLGIFETDEATLAAAAAAVAPRVIVFTNLMRDQLDRYGEIDAVRDIWLETLAALPPTTCVVLNADDPSVATLAAQARGPVRFFGLEDPGVALPPSTAAEHAADALWDPDTGADFAYTLRFYAHLGHWCAPGGAARPLPEVGAGAIDLAAPAGVTFDLADRTAAEGPPPRVALALSGLYNVYNALAAYSAARLLDLDGATARGALARTAAAFGRQEEFTIDGHRVRVLLGKNPAGLNAALRTLRRPGLRHHLLVLLNDGLADGTDVSWIWDTDWECLAPHVASVAVGGERAMDMTLRLQYAGFPPPVGAPPQDVTAALDQALAALPPGAPLAVLPTYTAMLAVREQLARRAGARPFWEDPR